MAGLQYDFQDIVGRLNGYGIEVKFDDCIMAGETEVDYVITGTRKGNVFTVINSIIINENGSAERIAFNLGVVLGQHDRYKHDNLPE